MLAPRIQSKMSSKNTRFAPTMTIDSEKENGPLDLAAIPKNVPSLCIPRVFPNISRERVEAVFRELDIGRVERVDIVVRTGDKGETLKRVFVHLVWNDSENAQKARERLLCGNDVKIIYEDPWFWKVSANRSSRDERPRDDRRPRDDQRPRDQRRPRDDQRPRIQKTQDVRAIDAESSRTDSVVVESGQFVPRSPSASPLREGEEGEEK